MLACKSTICTSRKVESLDVSRAPTAMACKSMIHRQCVSNDCIFYHSQNDVSHCLDIVLCQFLQTLITNQVRRMVSFPCL